MTAASHEIAVPKLSNDEHFHLLVSGVREYAIYMLDLGGRILSWNPGAERLKGYAEAEILGAHFSTFFTPEDLKDQLPQRILEDAKRLGAYRGEGWRIRKDGTRFWANVLVSALYSHEGVLRGYAKITRDETEPHRMEEQLRSSEERFRLLVGGLREHALYMLDPDGIIVSWNEGAERIKQYSAKEIVGRHFSLFFTADDRAARKPKRELEIATQMGVYEEEGWRLRKDGTRFWAAVVVTALRDGDGRIRGFAKVTRDETLRHQANVELQQALDRATEAERKVREHAEELEVRVADRTRQLLEQAEQLGIMNANLEQFAYVASHDLQEPLRMVSQHLELIRRRNQDTLDARSQESMAYAIDGAERMRALINSLLAYTRIDHMAKTCEPTDANRALSDAVLNLRQTIDEAKAVVETRTLPVLPIELEQLTQVFQNLISNGIKYNRSLPPKVSISASRDGSNWIVRVRDNGIGIDPSMVSEIFQPFRRLHGRDEFSGTGVGLAIVEKSIERHGGTLTVEPNDSAGTCFAFALKAG